MSLFRGTIRPPAILSDEAVERYLAAIRAELAPDPLFRRRLRGEVMNRFVAAREGMGAAPQRRTIGRLGRAVLYASFTLALTTTSVLAASQEALPGDLLYPLKRHVETLRMEVLPVHLHHDLAAYELAERIDELARLTELGDSARVAVMAAVVSEDYEAFQAEADAAGIETEDRYVTVLTALLERLPEPAREAVQAVVDRAPSHGNGPATGTGSSGSGNSTNGNASNGTGNGNGAGVPGVPNGNGNGNGAGAPGVSNGTGNGNGAGAPGVSNGSGNGNGNGPDKLDATQPTPKPTKSPKPEPTPRESRGPNPAAGGAPGANGQDDEDQHGP